MYLRINSKDYALTDIQSQLLLNQFHDRITAEYNKLEPGYKMVAKQIARGALSWIENRVKAERGVEDSLKVRPPKGTDPIPHLITIGEHLLVDMMSHVTISFTTTEDSTIGDFEVILKDKSTSG